MCVLMLVRVCTNVTCKICALYQATHVNLLKNWMAEKCLLFSFPFFFFFEIKIMVRYYLFIEVQEDLQ